MKDPPFKSGDRVRLKTGKSAIQVLEVDYFTCDCPANNPPRIKKWKRPRKGWYIRFAYVSSLNYGTENTYDRSWREADDFVFLDPPDQEEVTIDMTNILYETKDGKFGTKCGENSEGKWILEIKGAGGEVKAFDPKELTEVVPYSVELIRLNVEQGVKPERRHYRAKKDSVKVGDVLMQITTSALWKVNKIDTKSRTLHDSNNGFVRLMTEPVTVGKE